MFDNRKIIICNCLNRFYCVLVKGQSLEVTPNPVAGVVGGSVHITWTIKKKDENDIIGNTRLYLGDSILQSQLLYRGASPFDKLQLANARFGDRTQVTLIETNYTLILANLSPNDTTWFTLVVNMEDANLNPRPVIVKSVEISEVKGMHFFQQNIFINNFF